jgi:NADH-quinone oxidoreductase subunit G
VLGTDSIDFRVRATSAEETAFLASTVAGSPVHVSYDDLETAPVVVLVAFEPEDESPIVFLRLRKAARSGTRVVSVGAVATKGLKKMSGSLHASRPGAEADALRSLDDQTRALLAQPGAVIMVGERIAGSAGAASAAVALARETGAALAWVPRRAGERGALDAGALAGLLPGGRPLTDVAARSEVAAAWGVDTAQLPASAGLSGLELLEAAKRGDLTALLVGGVELADFADPALASAAVEAAGFVVSLENHHSAVTALADVVLPVGVVTEKAGTFLDWEGRPRPFGQVFRDALTSSDARVLSMIATALDVDMPADITSLRLELGRLGPWSGARVAGPEGGSGAGASGVVLASWRQLLDSGVMQEGEPHLAATARPTVALVSAATAAGLGDFVTITGPLGSVTLPVAVGDVLDDVVWVPMNSPGCHIHADLGVVPGASVQISAGGAA